MTIYDDILNKAKSQEDLQDVAQYLKKPLQLLHELQQKLEALPEREKNSLENTQVQIKVNNILNKYLPGMLDEYCKFALSYRNTHIIKNTGNNIGKTAKELLLDNIARITEESTLLHEEFHENNKFQFLVHNKLSSELGKQPQVAGALKLQNQFDYATHAATQGDIFKKEAAITIAKPVIKKEEPEETLENEYYGGGSFSLIEILLVIGFIAMAGMMTFIVYNRVAVGNAANIEARNLDMLRAGAKNLFAEKPNYNNITSSMLNDARMTPETMVNGKNIVNSFGGTVTVAPASLDGETNNAFTITYTEVPANICPKMIATVGSNFDTVKVADTTVKAYGSNNLDVASLASACTIDNAPKTVVFSSL